jgi:hypothetical protein
MEQWVYRQWNNGLSIYRSPGGPIKMAHVLIAQQPNVPAFNYPKPEAIIKISIESYFKLFEGSHMKSEIKT